MDKIVVTVMALAIMFGILAGLLVFANNFSREVPPNFILLRAVSLAIVVVIMIVLMASAYIRSKLRARKFSERDNDVQEAYLVKKH